MCFRMSEKSVSEDRERFFRAIKTEFAPRLREIGFKGSGKTFRRVSDEVIQVIHLQSDRVGERCCVNLGLQPFCVPVFATGELPNPAKLLEMDCELRWRLAPKGRADHWWQYSTWRRTPEDSVHDLVETFFEYGEPRLRQTTSLQSFCEAYPLAKLQTGEWQDALGGKSTPRTALLLARIHTHLGNQPLASEYARVGLEHLGNATLVRPELEKLMGSAS